MLVFDCPKCRTSLSADESQVSTLVRCPQCLTTLRVPHMQPVAESAPIPVAASPPPLRQPSAPPQPEFASAGGDLSSTTAVAAPPRRATLGSQFRAPGGGKRYGFNCVYCSSRLEATESMGAQEGTCPTCGNTIVIPILDRYGRLIDPITKQIIKQDPHPVHAYAAAGDRAPRILRQQTGSQVIQCPRCASLSAITSNNCKSCGMPFTMEGTTLEAAGGSNGFCVASLVLGIIGVPGGCTGILPILALVFGIIGYNQVTKGGGEGGGKGMAIAGIVCGCIGLMIAFLMWFR